MMMPEMNCARKAELNSFWLVWSKTCETSRWRPKTLTSACPE